MAIFGGKKKEKKDKLVHQHHTRCSALAQGMEHEVIRAPWFSEKALIATEKGIYTFAVPQRTTKSEIASAIKEIYKVSPKAVRIVNLPAKRKAMRTKRGVGVRAARRKAYVYLNAGDSIQFS
ncbi:MAG: 50S ribosomal protein L23 [Minisyncoccia bacterium]